MKKRYLMRMIRVFLKKTYLLDHDTLSEYGIKHIQFEESIATKSYLIDAVYKGTNNKLYVFVTFAYGTDAEDTMAMPVEKLSITALKAIVAYLILTDCKHTLKQQAL